MTARLVIPMLLLLGALAWGLAVLVETTAVRWFEEDQAAWALLGADDAEIAMAEAVALERAAWLHRLILIFFAGLAVISVALVGLLRWYLWRRWSEQLHEFATNDELPGRYAPALRDLRDLVDRIARRNED